MSVKLFSLRDVPDDEADGIRQLLEQHRLDYYETPGSGWGISAPCIWLRDEADLERAKALIDEYQRQFTAQARSNYQALKAAGRQPTLWGLICGQPLKVMIYVALILFFAYISISPFINFGE